MLLETLKYLSNKESIIDHKNLEKINNQKEDINEEIKKIFSK